MYVLNNFSLSSICAIVHLFVTWQFLGFVLCFTWGWRVIVMSVCSPNPVLLSTLLCTISSWNCPGHTFSHPDTSLFLMILVSLMYIIFQTALPVHICLLRVDYKNVLGKAAKEFLFFYLPLYHWGWWSPAPSHYFPKLWQKALWELMLLNLKANQETTFAGTTSPNRAYTFNKEYPQHRCPLQSLMQQFLVMSSSSQNSKPHLLPLQEESFQTHRHTDHSSNHRQITNREGKWQSHSDNNFVS